MDGKGNDALLKTSRVTEWTLNNGGYITFLFAGFLMAGCVSAYIIAVARGNVDPFLPLISDAAGSPPQNGIFGTLISLGGMIGVIFMMLRYMIVMEMNQEKSKLVTYLNKLSLASGILAMFGITLVTGYPMNFYRNRDVWLNDVGLPHMIGGVMLFALGVVYIAIQCGLTALLGTKDRVLLLTRTVICAVCSVAFVYHLVTVPDNFGGISKYYYDNSTEEASGTKQVPYPPTLGASLRLPIDTSGTYLSSAITEWVFVIFFCGFFLTFFKETQEYSLLVVIETQMTESESMNDVSAEPNGVGKQPPKGVNTGRRESEVRTLFRRDSTCQTLPDASVMSEKPNEAAFPAGKYTKRQISSFEVLSGDKLEELIESTIKKSKSDTMAMGNGNAVTNGEPKTLSQSVDAGVGDDVALPSEDQNPSGVADGDATQSEETNESKGTATDPEAQKPPTDER